MAKIYRRHGAAVLGLAWQVGDDVAAADDVTQDMFVQSWERPERFDPQRGTRGTFLLAQVHGGVDLVRTRAARVRRRVRDGSGAAPVDDLGKMGRDVLVVESASIPVADPPGGECSAMEMMYFGAHNYREVGDLLPDPARAVTSRVRSGLCRIRRALGR